MFPFFSGCLDTLTVANQLKLSVSEESREKAAINKVYSKEDFNVVNRFESENSINSKLEQ